MNNNIEGVSLAWEELSFLTDKYINEVNKNAHKDCCICTETGNEYPFLCEHAIHYECVKTWLTTNPLKRRCPVCKAPIRHMVYGKIKPKTITPVEINHDDKAMYAEMGYVECPECKVWVEKAEGCNRVSCERCGKSFNFEEQKNLMADDFEDEVQPMPPRLIMLSDFEFNAQHNHNTIGDKLNDISRRYQGALTFTFMVMGIVLVARSFLKK